MMSVSERRMFVLIWLLGGSARAATAADGAGCAALEADEWLEGAVGAGVDGTLEEEEEDLPGEGTSLCCGAFLGMVKLDLVTLSAPVAWIGPPGGRDGAWAGAWPCFLDFAAVLLGGAAGFLDPLVVAIDGEGFLPFGVTLAALVAGDFLFPLTGGADAGGGISGAGTGSFSFWSFSLGFSSFWGAGNKKHAYHSQQDMQRDSIVTIHIRMLWGPIIKKIALLLLNFI